MEYFFENRSENPHGYHDEKRVSQILLNLLSNSIKLTNYRTVKVILSKESDCFLIAVKDSGIGIS
jgi:signal transduction histidine kinase